MNDIIDNIKLTAKQIFNCISKQTYPGGGSRSNPGGGIRSNHGCYNHIRSLSMGIHIFLAYYEKINFPNRIKFNYEEQFCIIMATMFVSIGRINENNERYKGDTFQLNKESLESFYPHKHKEFESYIGYGQNFHQFISSLIYQTIMKHLLPNQYNIIEECGFFIQWYFNRIDTLTEKHKFLHYYIFTPHYIDHFRIHYPNMCNPTPTRFFNWFIKKSDMVKIKQKIYLKEIVDIIKTEYTGLEIIYEKNKANKDIVKVKNKKTKTFLSDDLVKEMPDIFNKSTCDAFAERLLIPAIRIHNNNYDFETVWNMIIQTPFQALFEQSKTAGRIKRKTNKKKKKKKKEKTKIKKS
jgi:hypothetical protein